MHTVNLNDDSQLEPGFGLTMLLAAYDHELFHSWRPGEESVWCATMQTLLDARGRVIAAEIPLRLRDYRNGNHEAVLRAVVAED